MQDIRSAIELQTWLPRVRQEIRGNLVYPLIPMEKNPFSNILWKPSGYDTPPPSHHYPYTMRIRFP